MSQAVVRSSPLTVSYRHRHSLDNDVSITPEAGDPTTVLVMLDVPSEPQPQDSLLESAKSLQSAARYRYAPPGCANLQEVDTATLSSIPVKHFTSLAVAQSLIKTDTAPSANSGWQFSRPSSSEHKRSASSFGCHSLFAMNSCCSTTTG